MKKPVYRPRTIEVDVKDVAATITFTGDPTGGSDPEHPEYGGVSFPKGKPVNVDSAWLAANPNVKKNSHFKVENVKDDK